MKFDLLTTTQMSVRNHTQVPGMAKFVKRAGVFNQDVLKRWAREHGIKRPSPLIQINRFEDGRHFILDGHHRALGVFAGGRDFFWSSEYQLLEYKYKDFTDIVFLHPNSNRWMGWTTPFDPRERVRMPNTKPFKDQVKQLYDEKSSEHAIAYIDNNIDLYSAMRDDLMSPVDTVEQLHSVWEKEHKQLLRLSDLVKEKRSRTKSV